MTLRNRVLIGWKIFYGDKTIITSKYCRWTQAPQKNVQVVKLFYRADNDKLEVNVHFNQEYYLLDDLLELPLEIKSGKAIDGEKFWEIKANAINDTEILTSMIDGS